MHRALAVALVVIAIAAPAAAQDADIVVIAGSRSAMPEACDATVAYYGPVEIGGLVLLDRHRPWRGDENWTPAMDAFIGRIATVVELAGLDPSGCPGIRVDIDGGQFFWRVRDLTLARRVTERTRAVETVTTTGYTEADPLQRYAMAYVDRSLTLGRGLLSPRLELAIARRAPLTGTGDILAVGGDISMYYGIEDFLELGADLSPVLFSPSVEHYNPSLGGTVRFLSGELEMGFRAHVSLPLRDGSSAFLQLALPILGHLGGVARIDVVPRFGILFTDPIATAFDVPVVLTFNATEYFAFGAGTAVQFALTDVDRTFNVPLWLTAFGSARGESGPILDAGATFSFDHFYGQGLHASVSPEAWTVSVFGRFYIYLL